jgi:hypothetical protein
MKSIDIVLVTWPNHPRRWEYFVKCAERSLAGLTACRHSIRWLCSSESERDPDRQWFGDELQAWCDAHGIPITFREGPASLGANMNAAMDLVASDYAILHQDDFLLETPCDVSDGVDFLESHPTADIVRYSWPGMDRVTVMGEVDGWRQLDPRGSWPYGDDPHLRRRSFPERFGRYIEGPPHGTAESNIVVEFGKRDAQVFIADQVYFGHMGVVPAVINDLRPPHPLEAR